MNLLRWWALQRHGGLRKYGGGGGLLLALGALVTLLALAAGGASGTTGPLGADAAGSSSKRLFEKKHGAPTCMRNCDLCIPPRCPAV